MSPGPRGPLSANATGVSAAGAATTLASAVAAGAAPFAATAVLSAGPQSPDQP